MHRTYQPYTPVTNIFLKQRWDKDVYQIHRRKVHATTAVIDNNAPNIYKHLNVKLKKLQIEAAREAEIDRDNQMLTGKMNHIMLTGGRTDHKNHYQSKSLNDAKHKRELVRVAQENRMILKRLAAREPNYNHKALLTEWQESQLYLKNISRYPPPSWTDSFLRKVIDAQESKTYVGKYTKQN